MPKRNGVIPNVHLRKNWKKWVRTYFDQPMAKKRRATKRAEKARQIAPRPTGAVRPIVRCPNNKNNHRERLGRGFTLEELAVSLMLCPSFDNNINNKVFHAYSDSETECIIPQWLVINSRARGSLLGARLVALVGWKL